MSESLESSFTPPLEKNSLPPAPRPGRKYSTATRLGKAMKVKGYTSASAFAGDCNISTRLLTEFLAGRKTPPKYLQDIIAEVLGVEADWLFISTPRGT